MKVLPKTLLLLAGIVWFIAGGNVTWIGIQSYADYLNILHLLGSSLVLSSFYGCFPRSYRNIHLEFKDIHLNNPFISFLTDLLLS